MRNVPVKALVVACGLALVAGCAGLNKTTPAQPVQALSKVTHSAAVVDAHYQIGRAYQDRRQYDAAIAAYWKSLELNPGNAEAHNALGVVYAGVGRQQQAITEFLAALALAPAAAHVHNNLGYAYLLAGRNGDAVAVLRNGSRLNPGNGRLLENIKIAEKRLGLDAANPAAPLMAVAPHAAIKPPVADTEGDPSMPRLVTVAPNILELRQGMAVQVKPPVAPVIQPAPAIQAAPARPGLPVRPEPALRPGSPVPMNLEIANGSGATGLARRTSSSLQEKGYTAIRLTNQRPYTQINTEIHFRHGTEQQAEQLNALLAVPARLVRSNRLSTPNGIRLVLGRDVGTLVRIREPLDPATGGRTVALATGPAAAVAP